ncbi:MAG TPA: GNAT family N-acetyltransferase [Jatrophihabitans sp.]|nr:GNAT family N-acetyltransferase [Jatrophihabitans sp.]
MGTEVHDAAVAELDAATLYAILALRAEVFVVEQQCVYLDPDGRDLEPSARQLWVTRDGAVIGTLRLLVDPDGAVRIGRVSTRRDARGSGIAAALVARALQLAGARDVVLDAQTYLFDWYARFGFVRAGADFLDDGIPHVPMRRAAVADA